MPRPELDFGIELARPEVTGGIAVILQHPDPSQEYGDGFAVEEVRCRTLAAVKELVQLGSGYTMDTESVTVLDCMPFMTDDFDESDIHKESQETALKALEAKKPDVVISCFRTKTANSFMRRLQANGVGVEPRESTLFPPESIYSFTKISAFHPGFAMNYMKTESCFRRLLALQFVKAFGVWRGAWNEEQWMDDLRKQCAEISKQYRGIVQCENSFHSRSKLTEIRN